MKIVVVPNGSDGVSIIRPATEPEDMAVFVAGPDVPPGPYAIVDDAELLARPDRNRWQFDFTGAPIKS